MHTVEECGAPDGLEHINDYAFMGCTSLERIDIPSSTCFIHKNAFRDCRGLVAVEFCQETEEFVTELSLRQWWNNGVSKLSLLTGPWLSRWVGMVRVHMWKLNIHVMLQHIPTMLHFNNNDDEDYENDTEHESADAYFDSINSQLITYEKLQECVPPILEPVINCGGEGVIPHVLSFL